MPAPPQTPRRMRVIGGITGGSLRSPSKVERTTTTTTTITPKGVRVQTVVNTVETYAGESNEDSLSDTESDIDYEDDYEDFNEGDFPEPPEPAPPSASRRAPAQSSDPRPAAQPSASRAPGQSSASRAPGQSSASRAPGQSSGSRVPTQPSGSRAYVPMKKSYRATPPNALLKFRGPCYILTRAQETGLFRTRKQLLERIAGLGRRATWERRQDYEDGVRIYTALYNAGFVSAEPLPGSRFANNAYDLVPAIPDPVIFREPDKQRHPSPSDFRQGNMYKFYVVTKGEQVGIFGSWVEASARVDSLRHFRGRASWMRYDSFRAAFRAYTIAYHLDELVATPVVGGYFDRLDDYRRRS